MGKKKKYNPQYEISLEYESLRKELIQSTRYVFERPLLIVTVFFTALNFVKSEYAPLLPFLLIAILLFNFWFTVNRLRSMARIVAYNQVVLDDKESVWIGWENFLRCYRKWMKRHSILELREFITKNIVKEAIPDALMFYPPIFRFHLLIVTISILGSVYYVIDSPVTLNIVSLCLTLFVGLVFFRNCIVFSPGKMKGLIERDRVICKDVQKSINLDPEEAKK